MSATPTVSPLRRTLRLLRPHLRQHLTLIVGGLLALTADVVLRVLKPWPVKFAIDAVSVALGAQLADATGIGASPATTLVTAALAIGLIIAGRALANYAATVAFALTGARVATELRSRVFAHVQTFPCAITAAPPSATPRSGWSATSAGCRRSRSPRACPWWATSPR